MPAKLTPGGWSNVHSLPKRLGTPSPRPLDEITVPPTSIGVPQVDPWASCEQLVAAVVQVERRAAALRRWVYVAAAFAAGVASAPTVIALLEMATR